MSTEKLTDELPVDKTLQLFTLVEGISLIILIGIAMPLKYIWNIPEAVKVMGWLHGILFVILMVLITKYCLRISDSEIAIKTFIILFFSAFLPLGWMIADKYVFEKSL